MKLNERTWAGHIISWIKEAINQGTTIFEEATNDEGLKVTDGKTRFPDILLFINKTAGIVFNGWELKFPDTASDDRTMLLNALEKAQFLKSYTFVTWNANQAIIWGIANEKYDLENLYEIKRYSPSKNINKRYHLDNRSSYQKNEKELKNTLLTILSDLQSLYQKGEIKVAVNISTDIVSGIKDATSYLIPLFKNIIENTINTNLTFQSKFAKWKILEQSTLKILKNSSRRNEQVEETQVLAKFHFYKLIGKIIFYYSLSKNLPQHIPPIKLINKLTVKKQLDQYFDIVKAIDFQAVFDSDFTDILDYNKPIEDIIVSLIKILNSYDFRILPTEVIGTILENLVPQNERQKFGQYFTPKILTYLVSLSVLRTRDDLVYDPTAGTGSFLDAFYTIKKAFGADDHQTLLKQIWGNDISHFPAVLSVINLYKQEITNAYNFPRVTRQNYFNLNAESQVSFPSPNDETILVKEQLPFFDCIVSNFPFIRQEDIESESLTKQFKDEFGQSQPAFLKNNRFELNERTDYFVYCFYHALKFLKSNGRLSAITSNAWLGKEYGLQFKQFLLDNFTIKYIVKSTAEHWFKNSQASTIFISIQKGQSNSPVKFINIQSKLEDLTKNLTDQQMTLFFRDFYTDIDHCELKENKNWKADLQFSKVFNKVDGSVKVAIVSRKHLLNQIEQKENWNINFIAEDPLQDFQSALINPYPNFIDSGRGTRTGWDDLHIVSQTTVDEFNINQQFLIPYLRNSKDILSIKHNHKKNDYLFVCDKEIEILKQNFPDTYNWVKRFKSITNKIGIPIPEKFEKEGRELWYALQPEKPANIFISINPNARLFFAYSNTPVSINQRLVALRASEENIVFYAALLNSILSLLMVELNGVSRNLGALDLNANFFKTKMKFFNPNLINKQAQLRIVNAFEPLALRNQFDYDQEFIQMDRIKFDKVVFNKFGFDTDYLPKLYNMLTQLMRDRIEIKYR